MKLQKEEYYFLKREIASSCVVFDFLTYILTKRLSNSEDLLGPLFDNVLFSIDKQKELGEDDIKKYIATYLATAAEIYTIDAYIRKGLYNIENIKKEAEIQNIRDTFKRFDNHFKIKLANFIDELLTDAANI